MQTIGDGIVIYYTHWGTGNKSISKGNIPIHEIGHYWGLNHLWGVPYDYSKDDGLEDTPPQYEPTFESCYPGYEFDSCSASHLGIMYNNFMQFTGYDCTTMFTHQQKEVMHATLNIIRSELVENLNCSLATNTSNSEASFDIKYYPNPSKEYLTIKAPWNTTEFTIDIMSIQGIKAISKKNITNINTSNLTPGMYILQVTDSSGRKYVDKKLIE